MGSRECGGRREIQRNGCRAWRVFGWGNEFLMPQFSVHKNKNPKTRATYPYLVDVQSDLLSGLSTRVVVPLVRHTAVGRKPIGILMPVVSVEGQSFVMLVPQLAG